MSIIWKGILSKLNVELLNSRAIYRLKNDFVLNDIVGREIKITFQNNIECTACGKSIKKTYGDGVCFNCLSSLASCDICIVKPELCHFDQGTCRDEEWGKKNCFAPHIVYLSYTSGIKVGITRKSQVPTRWIDQGATYAIPIFEVATRKIAGEIEQIFAKNLNDKTNWRKMLIDQNIDVNMSNERDVIFDLMSDELDFIEEQYIGEVDFLENDQIDIKYPVMTYPEKVTSTNFDKVKEIEGKLIGIKGQYLISNDWVINLRRHSGYQVEIKLRN